MEEEVVRRRRWLTPEEFLDLVGAVNLLPGPNSTELAIAIGRRRAGIPGLLVAGVAFILPSMLLVLACAWAYTRFSRLPAVEGLWRGVKPVVVAVVAVALIRFGTRAVKSWELALVAIVASILAALNVHELLVLFVSGLLAVAPGSRHRIVPVVVPVPWLFLFFLKTGALIYGGGYVLLSFLHHGLVERGGWLTEAQLLDAVAIGQMTPGPVFTTATFVGYLLAGTGGAVAATVGIFLPAFVFVGLGDTLIRRVQRSPILRTMLDGVNVGALALMLVVTWQLGRAAFDGPPTALVGTAALVLIWAGVNSALLIAAGALAGVLLL